jgi:hypothetical protein
VGDHEFDIAGGVNERCWVLGNSWSTIVGGVTMNLILLVEFMRVAG